MTQTKLSIPRFEDLTEFEKFELKALADVTSRGNQQILAEFVQLESDFHRAMLVALGIRRDKYNECCILQQKSVAAYEDYDRQTRCIPGTTVLYKIPNHLDSSDTNIQTLKTALQLQTSMHYRQPLSYGLSCKCHYQLRYSNGDLVSDFTPTPLPITPNTVQKIVDEIMLYLQANKL